MKKRINVQIQLDSTDCGPACLSTVVKYYKGNVPIDRIRELSGKSKKGTTLLGLYQAAKEIGFEANGCIATIDSLIEHGKPTILHVLLNKELEHYIVFFSYSNGFFLIGDPGVGLKKITKEELDSIWVSKACLTLEPNTNFLKAKEDRLKKYRLIHEFLKPDLPIINISILIGVVISVLGLATAVFSQKLIDDILPDNSLKKLYASIIILAVLQLLRVVFSTLRSRLLLEQGKAFNDRMLTNFYKTVLSIKMSFFDTRMVGDLVTRLQDTRRIQGVVAQIIGSTIIDFLIVIVSIGALFYYLSPVGLVSVVGLPIYFILIFLTNKKIVEKQHCVMSSYAIVESNFIKSIEGISTVKDFCLEENVLKKGKKSYTDFLTSFVDLGVLNINLGLRAGIVGIVLMAIIISIASFHVRTNAIEVGGLIAIISIASSTFPAIANLAIVAIPLNEAKVAFERIYEISSYPIEKTEGKSCSFEVNRIDLKNISFRYPGSKLLLNNSSFNLEKGKMYALFGKSGSGKSTLCHLFERFYSLEKGEILVDDLPLESISLHEWRSKLSVIPQEINIFNGTIVDNISLQDDKEDETSVISFCENFGLSSYFNSFPNGYKTIVGEKGVNLSGGQKQILALARALYKKPKMLILDEATSALDELTEQFVMGLLKRINSEMIVLFITHKKNLINYVDEAYTLNNGVIYRESEVSF